MVKSLLFSITFLYRITFPSFMDFNKEVVHIGCFSHMPGNNSGPKDEASSWSEEYQEQIYRDQITMFGKIPDLCGVFPWLLADYRSSGRMHPVYQKGWNRKGLLSDKGEKKKAWFILKSYYNSISNGY